MTDQPVTSYGEDTAMPPTATAVASTPLASLLADFADAQQLHESTEVDVPGKPGVTVRYSTDVAYEQYAAWRRAAVDAEMKGFNELTFAVAVLVGTCQSLRTDGEDTTDGGLPVTFTTPSLLSALGVTRPADAVRKFYRRDGYLIAAANHVISEAGFGAEASPTTR